MTRSGPPDTCGTCLTADTAATVTPYLTEPEGEGAVRSYYRCQRCGARWHTSRLLSDEELAQYGRGAA
jgi:hypothetical protein